MIKLTGRRSVAPSYMVGGGAQRARFVEIDSGEDGGQAKPSHRAARAGCSLFQGGAASGELKIAAAAAVGRRLQDLRGGGAAHSNRRALPLVLVRSRRSWLRSRVFYAAGQADCSFLLFLSKRGGLFSRQATLNAPSHCSTGLCCTEREDSTR